MLQNTCCRGDKTLVASHPMNMTALERVVEKAGSQSKFADAVGWSQQLVSYYVREKKPLPAEYVLKAEAEFGISRHDLRPDIYPRESEAA